MAAAGDVLHDAAVRIRALHFAVEDVHRVLVEVAGVEDGFVATVLGDRGFGPELLACLRAQGIQREQLGEFGCGYGHKWRSWIPAPV